MARIRTNNVFGTTTDNPLTNVATTMNSAGLANLAAVAAPDTAVITLDPNRVGGAPEIVFVTAHTGAATSATITRGEFGTAAREHPLGTEWVHGPVAAASGDTGDYPEAMCRVFEADTAQTLTHNTLAVILFDSERYDTDAMHSTASNTGRITFNTAGVYDVGGGLFVTGEADYTSVVVDIRLNGATVIARDRLLSDGAFSASTPAFNPTCQYRFVVGDFIELTCTQENTSGNAEATVVVGNVSPEFWACRLGVG